MLLALMLTPVMLAVFGHTGVFLIIGQTSLDFEVRPSAGALAGALGPRAVGARRPRSALRGQVQPFTPLLLSWFGKSEVRTLHAAEWRGGLAPLSGMPLLCGFYLNELLLKLLARDDPHEALFDYYLSTLGELAQPAECNLERVLRRFERHLLSEIGYAATFHEEAETARPVRQEQAYYFVPERGPYSHHDGGGAGIPVSGQTLLDMDQDRFDSPVTRSEAKQLMRALIITIWAASRFILGKC